MHTKKMSIKTKRRVFLISVVTLGLISAIFVNMFSVWGQMLEIRNDKIKFSNELENLKEDETALKLESEKLKDPDYIAKYAREQFLYSKDGEINIIMPN